MRSRRKLFVFGAVIAAIAAALLLWFGRGGEGSQANSGAAASPGRDTTEPTAVRTLTGAAEAAPFIHDDDRPGVLLLEGQVIDADNQPVAGAEVTLDTNPVRMVISGEDGTFSFDRLVGRPYVLAARAASGFAGPVTAHLTARSEPVILKLRPGATIEVRAVSAVDGTPVVGASVELRALATITGTTGADGVARLVGVGPGRYSAVAWADGFGKAYQEVRVPAAPGNGEVAARIQLRLLPGAPVAGRVVAHDGTPIQGARVRFAALADFATNADPARDAIVTDADGRFRFEAIPSGTFRFLATHTSHAPADSGPVALDGKTARTDLEIRMDEGATLAGLVVASDGSPVGWATIRIEARSISGVYASPRQAYADEQGHFELGGLPQLPMLVVALADSATSEMTTIDLSCGDVRDAVITLNRDGAIAGIVVDETGEPIEGASVWAASKVGGGDMKFQRHLRGYSQELTDAGGRFAIHGLMPGDYLLYASRTGGAVPGDVRLRTGTPATVGDQNVKVVLPAEGGIKGTVLYADGTAPVLFTVEVDKDAPVPFATSDGRFAVSGLAAGALSIRVEGPSFDPMALPDKTIGPGELLDLGTITVRKGRAIRGVVVVESGEPVAGAQVFAGARIFGGGTSAGAVDFNLPGARDSKILQATSDADGRFTLHGVGKGGLSIMAEHDEVGRSRISTLPASTESGEVELVLLPFAAIAGTVTKAGQPVADVIVTAASETAATSSFVVSSGSDGTFRFDHLAPDTYRVSAVVGRSPKVGFSYTGREVTAVSGQTARVDLAIDDGIALLVTVKPTNATELHRALVYVMAGAQTASNAKQAIAAAAVVPGYSFVGAALEGAPARANGVPVGAYTVCAIAIPNEVEGMSKAFAYIDREGENMPATCKAVEVAAAPAEQPATIETSVPTYVPPPDGEETGGGGAGDGGGGNGGGGAQKGQPHST